MRALSRDKPTEVPPHQQTSNTGDPDYDRKFDKARDQCTHSSCVAVPLSPRLPPSDARIASPVLLLLLYCCCAAVLLWRSDWEYQLFMAQRAREFRERAERSRNSRAQAQHTAASFDEPRRGPSDPWGFSGSFGPGGGGGPYGAWGYGASSSASSSSDPNGSYSAHGRYSYDTYSYGRAAAGGQGISPELSAARKSLGLPMTGAVTEEAVRAAFHKRVCTRNLTRRATVIGLLTD
jgi:hypothetical protein